MSLRLSANHLRISGSGSESEEHASSSSEQDEDEDLTWDDWVSDSMDKRPCKSLFEDKTFPSVAECLAYDEATYQFNLDQTSSRLSLDLHQRIRLINWIRKQHPTPSQVAALQGREAFLSSDDYLIPTLEDDPLLQVESADWTDSEDEQLADKAEAPVDLASATRRIKQLEEKLQQAKQDLVDYRSFVTDRLDVVRLAETLHDAAASSSTHVGTPLRDDDSHYFQSYASNDIHAVMIQDKVRTASYAKFIQSNPELFRNAIVLDVGCGTGILSLFAARAGAKRVFAVDASDIAEKAEQIVKDNGLDNIITVIRGKVEDIVFLKTSPTSMLSSPNGWDMHYCTSLCSTPVHARDRSCAPKARVMAPSQCQMMFGLCEAVDIFKERVAFWGDVYGFDLSAMASDLYDDAIVDVVGGETVFSQPCVVKDLFLGDITAKQLDFSSPFKLVSTAERRTKIHAFVLYFDTYFTSTGERIPPDTDVYIVREGDPIVAEVWPLGGRPHVARRASVAAPLKGEGRPKVTSFSTGPASVPTHWKQTLFLLRDPISVNEGTVVQGTFKCRKSEDNTRELNVEIHYVVSEPTDSGGAAVVGDATVQMFKVR
ncbi:Ribosomal protein arginine N-methyltransferase rmt3 [Grifola frondosa]|uniref:type I protein arginine methyltransferase n=1 Tax=Grifola frondosa TaxID=5627 RepID=A0A1C7M533_GRIFR|nr:Ribosomal protein arginine N-methyltransferase rmt3 [Grifola frondosa]